MHFVRNLTLMFVMFVFFSLDFNRHFPDNPQFKGNHTTVPPPRELQDQPFIGRLVRDEYGLKAYYNFAITPWLQLSADIQSLMYCSALPR